MTEKFSALAKRVDREIKDPKLKNLLFLKSHDLEEEDILNIDGIYRMLAFSFIFSFAKYKYDASNGSIQTDLPNAKRVIESFDCIFTGEDIGLDLIVYIMSEIQLDVFNNGRRSYFYGICGNRETKLQINTLRRVIKMWLHSIKGAEQKQERLAEYFTGLYDTLDVLRNIELLEDGKEYKFKNLSDKDDVVQEEKVGKDFKFRYTAPNGKVNEIPCYGLFKLDSIDDSFYYLTSIEKVDGHQIKLTYTSLDGSDIDAELMSLKDFKERTAVEVNAVPKTIFAKSLFSLSFKYIKNLSLAVSDSLTKDTKQRFYEEFSHRYSEVFAQLGYRCFEDVSWDNVLTILMFEEGPSELLEFILDSDGFYFDLILRNLEVRYNKPGFAKSIRDSYEKVQDAQMKRIRRLGEDAVTARNIITINETIMAKSIIDGLGTLEHKEKHPDAPFVESLPMRIRNIDKIVNSYDSIESKTIKVNKILEKTFRYVIPFYYGIIAYQNHREHRAAELLDKTFQNSTEKDMFMHKVHQESEDCFFAEARKWSVEIKGYPVGKLIEQFRKLAISFTKQKKIEGDKQSDSSKSDKKKQDGLKMGFSNDGKLLKSAIGRSYLCSVSTFNDLLTLRKPSANAGVELTAGDVVQFINTTKHDKHNVEGSMIETFWIFITNVKKLLYYFIYNEDFERELLLGQQISFDPIYPYVVRYVERSENRDGYNINSFSVAFSEDVGEREIKILSEREYKINEKYYCIPNVTMSNSRWWIEPFLIECKRYEDEVICGNLQADDEESISE